MSLIEATATQQTETGTVRVTRWDFPPGSETGHHRHEFDYVVVPLTGGVLSITSESGETVEAPLTAGQSYERTAGVEHNVVNRTDTEISFVEIELLEHPETGNN